MCGIAGILSFNTSPEREDLQRMTDAVSHRGPDAEGYYINNHVALGHRRLSIIDLDSRSNQPFFSNDKRYVIVFNGEIYNYRQVAKELNDAGITLRTTSDTEVLIEAFAVWGCGFIHKMNGMFAFVIYDTLENRLFIFRDRVGKKPLFYFLKDDVFLFGSEIKSILAHPVAQRNKANNTETISKFLQLGYIPEPDTFFKGIRKFPAGHYGVISSDLNLSILPYWNVSHYVTTRRDNNEIKAFGKLKELVTDAVHSRMVADVPVGVFLSGGIDSSLVTAVASKVGPLKTFSIGFKESKFNESEFASNVANHLGTIHSSYVLEEKEAVEMLEQYVKHFDEPFADTSAIPTMLVSRLARQEVTVALTGDGGDELFLGYGSYTWANRLNNPLLKIAGPLLKHAFELAPSSRWKRVARLFEYVDAPRQRAHIFSQEQYFFSEGEVRNRLLKKEEDYTVLEYNDFNHLAILSAAEQQALFDFQFYLKDDLLVKVDRASMFYGLECRSPLLDHRLVEFAVNLPESFKKKGNVTKYLLRKMLYEMVPEKHFDRPKWGFSIPLSKWIKEDLDYLMSYLSRDQLAKTNVFSIPYVENLILRFYKGEDYLYNRLWVLILIQKFLLQQ